MPRAVFLYVVFCTYDSVGSEERETVRGVGDAKRTRRDGSIENEMCVKLYSERRVFDDQDGRMDVTECRCKTKARIRGWNKKLRVRECA